MYPSKQCLSMNPGKVSVCYGLLLSVAVPQQSGSHTFELVSLWVCELWLLGSAVVWPRILRLAFGVEASELKA